MGHLAHCCIASGTGSSLPPSLLVASAHVVWLCLEEGPSSHWAKGSLLRNLMDLQAIAGATEASPCPGEPERWELKTETPESALP